MSDRVVAPFTRSQVESLNRYQFSGRFHEFTCGTLGCRAALLATSRGWICPMCNYTQDWAHAWMTDDRWTRLHRTL